MESPLRLTAHGGFGEGDGETRLSEGRKVRPVPTLRSGGGVGDRPADHDFARQPMRIYFPRSIATSPQTVQDSVSPLLPLRSFHQQVD